MSNAPLCVHLVGEALAAYLRDARAWIDCLCATALAVARRDEAAITDMRQRERAAAESFSGWNRRGAPHIEVARELELSPMAGTILLLVAAPQIWGELARNYAACANDPARPLVDELLLAHLLEADISTRSVIGGELDDTAPLVRRGAIELGRGVRPYATLSAHPAIARRLAGIPIAEPATGPNLVDVIGPRSAIAALVRELAEPGAPARVVVRGRRGAGRRTLAAALARPLGRGITVIDGRDIDRVAERLRDAALRGWFPCIDLDDVATESFAQLRATLDAHAGPLFVRAPSDGDLPLAPGFAQVALPMLSETERLVTWQAQLTAHGLDPALASSLASRFAIGPGPIERACASASRGPHAADPAEAINATIRQHHSARIAAMAERIDRLATWEQLVVSGEIDDALRELCARVRHRRTVLETWGMEHVAPTARAVTALFQGGPGTGKSMAAGVIARALGRELWRIDLSKVMSKWIGETEKNLAAVFDAAEEGEIVLLFDEADSLFAKRTDVKSSNDKHANLATNFLLQRLDTFTGVAILTTNFGTAIDPAFKRRIAVCIGFPFPDETDRERLWRAHLPASLPTHGELELATLAGKYQLTGGYIRNAVLRAAYLAADRGTPITAEHLRLAVQLEKDRAGKLGDGRLE